MRIYPGTLKTEARCFGGVEEGGCGRANTSTAEVCRSNFPQFGDFLGKQIEFQEGMRTDLLKNDPNMI